MFISTTPLEAGISHLGDDAQAIQIMLMKKITRLNQLVASSEPVSKGIVEITQQQPDNRAQMAQQAAAKKLERLKGMTPSSTIMSSYRYSDGAKKEDRLQGLLDKRSQIQRKLERLTELASS